MSELTLRKVQLSDAKALLEIYAPCVFESHISFEYKIPSLGDFEKRVAKISSKFPYYVAEYQGRIVGYAYASHFRERAAYGWILETSVYVAEDFHGSLHSPAKSLYEKLFADLKDQGIKQVIGVISLPNEKSVKFHEKLGFKVAGTFPSAGFKLGQWWDVVFMAKCLENLPFSPPKGLMES
jgi:L-amino acid N-acyltransferase YncA